MFLVSLPAFSQFKVGVRLGVSSTSLKAKDLVVSSDTRVETLNNTLVGFQGGVMAQVSMFGIFLQPELLFTTSGGQILVKDATYSRIVDQKFNNIEIPVLVGAKFGPLRLGVGPVATMVLKSKSELDDVSNYGDKFNKATFGYQAGVGLDIWKFAIDLKYEGNLSKLGNGVNIKGQSYSFDSREHQLILGLGIFF